MGSLGPLAGERFHLYGVAGRGMAPLAVVAQHLGAEVSGCDRAGARDGHRYLAREGVPVEREHAVAHLTPATTLVATSVAAEDEPEIRAAKAAGAYWHRTDLLAAVLRTRRSLGVTGSHGKGTVTALATTALTASGLDPLGLVGVPVPAFDGLTRLGAGPIVAEVDNSDLSLARVACDVAVVTNLDDDHPTLGFTVQDAIGAVGAFVAQARERVILGPSPRASALAAHAGVPVWRYGRDFSARTVSEAAGETVLDLRGPGRARERAVVRLLGPRTGHNAAVAFAAALALGAEPGAAATGLGEVTSLSRRLELVGIRDGVRVFDDYATKHPVSVREGLLALRRHFPDAAIIAVFEPYGPFLSRWARRYARVLGLADRVVLLPAAYATGYLAGRPVDPSWVQSFATAPLDVDDHQAAADAAMRLSKPGDVVVCLSVVPSGRLVAKTALQGGSR